MLFILTMVADLVSILDMYMMQFCVMSGEWNQNMPTLQYRLMCLCGLKDLDENEKAGHPSWGFDLIAYFGVGGDETVCGLLGDKKNVRMSNCIVSSLHPQVAESR